MKRCKVCMKPIGDEHEVCTWCNANVTILGENEPFQEWTNAELTQQVISLKRRIEEAGL